MSLHLPAGPFRFSGGNVVAVTALQTFTRARFDAIQNLTREKQRFANYLFLKCSGIARDKDIQNTSATTIALMEYFETVDDLANADLDKLPLLQKQDEAGL